MFNFSMFVSAVGSVHTNWQKYTKILYPQTSQMVSALETKIPMMLSCCRWSDPTPEVNRFKVLSFVTFILSLSDWMFLGEMHPGRRSLRLSPQLRSTAVLAHCSCLTFDPHRGHDGHVRPAAVLRAGRLPRPVRTHHHRHVHQGEGESTRLTARYNTTQRLRCFQDECSLCCIMFPLISLLFC